MKKSTKALIDKLLGYGFRQGEPDLTGKLVFFHANEPQTMLKVWPGISAARAHAVDEQARRIVGLSVVGGSHQVRVKAGPKRQRPVESKAERAERERYQREADARAKARRDARADQTRNADWYDIERAIQLYVAGNRLADCARHCKVGLEALRAALIQRGCYHRKAIS